MPYQPDPGELHRLQDMAWHDHEDAAIRILATPVNSDQWTDALLVALLHTNLALIKQRGR